MRFGAVHIDDVTISVSHQKNEASCVLLLAGCSHVIRNPVRLANQIVQIDFRFLTTKQATCRRAVAKHNERMLVMHGFKVRE
jgi:hypothetical protein